MWNFGQAVLIENRRYLPDIRSRAPKRRRRWSNRPYPTLELVAGSHILHRPRHSLSPAAVSSVIHALCRSSSSTAASSTVYATSELITGSRFLLHPRPTMELVADSHTAASSTVHAASELVAGGRVLPRLDELAKYVLVVLRADGGGEGNTFAFYFLICCRVRVVLLLPCAGAGAAGEELTVAGQCVDSAGVGAAAHVSHARAPERHRVLQRLLLLLRTCMVWYRCSLNKQGDKRDPVRTEFRSSSSNY
uniref:Uncharacterized protein n=1 Tax=Oryza barthii TaxID=65489 RepID=A0A0D3FB23_9ORYZ